jgi:hypothetical protein
MNPSFALITPSFSGDFERCKLLVESVARCVAPPQTPYYLIVPAKDVPLFATLNSFRPVILIPEESLLPWHIFRTPFSRKWRLNLFGLPVRGWMVQQICKLAIAEIIREEVMVIVDSDICFVRRVDLNHFVREDGVRLLSVPGRGNEPAHYPWHRVAARLLGLPARDYFGNGYIGNVVTWRRDVVLQLIQQLKKRGRFWKQTVLNQMTFSEYILYGVFAEFVLQDRSGHYKETNKEVKEYWTAKPLTDDELARFFDEVQDCFAIMITAKAGMPIQRYRPMIEKLWSRIETPI